jgi:hypothetical protein
MRRLSVLLVCVVMALTLIAITVATGASAAPKQQTSPNHFYGAVDWSKAKNAVAWGSGTSKGSANRAAYNRCRATYKAKDCLTVVWVYNGWVAIAESNKYLGAGWGRTKQQAWNTAVKRCQSGGAPPCKVTAFQKTALDPNKKTTGGYSLPGP